MNPKSSQTGFGLHSQEKFPNDIKNIYLKTQLIELIYCDLMFKAISHSNFGKGLERTMPTIVLYKHYKITSFSFPVIESTTFFVEK